MITHELIRPVALQDGGAGGGVDNTGAKFFQRVTSLV